MLVGHETNQGRQIYKGRHAYLTKKYNVSLIITKCDGIITNCDSFVYYKVRWTVITNCDRYYKIRCIFYKLRQVLQSAMIITNCDSTAVSS